jgi:hypothetical protein
MAIKLYPNRVFRSLPTPVDAITHKETVKQFKGVKDTTAAGISDVITPKKDWKVVGIKFTFSSGTSSDYSASIIGGRSVILNLNDFLFFQTERTMPQKITLDEAFYTGTELAAHLKTKMDANAAFTALGLTFTVSYAAGTGLYSITPNSGNLKYLELNEFATISDRYSIAGHLFGLNANTAFTTPVTSDTAVPGLDAEVAVIDQTSATVLSHYNSDPHYLSIDEAVKIETDITGITVNYSVDYQELLT